MRLEADRPVRHRAGREPLDDLADRLDLLDRHRRVPILGRLEVQQPPQGHQALGLVVDVLAVLLEDVVATRARGVLQPEHRLGIEEVRLAFAAPLVLAPHGQGAMGQRDPVRRVGRQVPPLDLLGQFEQADAAELGRGAGEVAVHQLLGQPERLEDLRPGVGGHRRDAHLAHHLEHALAEGLDQVGGALARLDVGVDAVPREVLHRLDRQVRVDRRRAVADQQRDVVDLPDVAGLDDQTDLGAGLLPDEVVVYGRGQQQRRDRRQLGVGVPVGEDDDPRAVGDRRRDLGADVVQLGRQRVRPAGHRVQPAGHIARVAGQVAVPIDVEDLGQRVVVEHRERQHQPPTRRRTRIEQVPLRPDGVVEGGDQFLADRVERRVGHLGEELGEVVEQRPGLLTQRGDRGVGAHRPDRLGAAGRHRRQDQPQLLLGVAEDLLTAGHRGVGVHDVLPLGQIREEDPTARPATPRTARPRPGCP